SVPLSILTWTFADLPSPVGSLSALCGWDRTLLPNSSLPQHRPHHPHQIVGRRHQGDFLPLRILALSAREVSPDGRRPALRLPDRLGQQLADDGRALAGDVPELVAAAGLVLAKARGRSSGRRPWRWESGADHRGTPRPPRPCAPRRRGSSAVARRPTCA